MMEARWLVLGFCLAILSAFSVLPAPAPEPAEPADNPMMSIERFRYSEILSWTLTADDALVVEMNAPRRRYLLMLQPSCTFALRQALSFDFSGKSARYISVGDDVVVGEQRCRIVSIQHSEAQHAGSTPVSH